MKRGILSWEKLSGEKKKEKGKTPRTPRRWMRMIAMLTERCLHGLTRDIINYYYYYSVPLQCRSSNAYANDYKKQEKKKKRKKNKIIIIIITTTRWRIEKKKKRKKETRKRVDLNFWGERVIMVVTYDRFVFFSVEKFFIPLLYSCLNILVRKKKKKKMRETVIAS